MLKSQDHDNESLLMTQFEGKMALTKIVGNSIKLVWMLNKDLIQIDVMEQLKILIIYLAINEHTNLKMIK